MGLIMGTWNGKFERQIFRNSENGWTVFVLDEDNGSSQIVTGITNNISEGDCVSVEGEIVKDKKYGSQIKASVILMELPTREKDIVEYLKRNIVGVGPVTAKAIVSEYGEDTFKIIAEMPEQLSKISKISEKKAKKIALQLGKLSMSREEQMFFIKLGLSDSQIAEIKNLYGDDYKEIIQENPYKLINTIKGVGFKKADEIAQKYGIVGNNPFRVKAGIKYCLEVICMQHGHIYYPIADLVGNVSATLKVEKTDITKQITELAMEKDIVVNNGNVYLKNFYNEELYCARKILDLLNQSNISKHESNSKIIAKIKEIEKENGKELDDSQRNAVLSAVKNDIMIITGGPGVGKTTTLDIIIKYMKKYITSDIVLLAPTGRAAKRMSEQTKMEASTIHRLVGCGTTDESDEIENDVIIIDEMSMVDIHVMYMLLSKVVLGTKILLIGDVDQIPSVGPGLILKDLIDSGRIPVAKLTKIHRQAEGNHIITNAHKINDSQMIELDGKNKDFFFASRHDSKNAMDTLLSLYTDLFPRNLDIRPIDVQILTPVHKGEFGTINLNKCIQALVNPAQADKNEIEKKDVIFREGDKVMHIKNDYGLAWKNINEKGKEYEGTGVFNGEGGIIVKIDKEMESLFVKFEDGKVAEYDFDDLDKIMQSYAITIHKSQGSEYPAVIIPLLYGGGTLYNKNLLYTAVTRAKTSICILGNEQVVYRMIKNISAEKRYTSLKERMEEMDNSSTSQS